MDANRNKKILQTFLALTLGFILFAAGSVRLLTKAVLLKYGLTAQAQITNVYKRGVANSGYGGNAFVSYEHYAELWYRDRAGQAHTVRIRIPRGKRKLYQQGRRVAIIYNPRFPDYSVKPVRTVARSTWGPDIFLTASGLLIMGGAFYFARRNYLRLT